MTLQTRICGYIAEVLAEVGKLPDIEYSELPFSWATIETRSILEELIYVRDRVKMLQKLLEEGEENEQAPVS